MADMDTKVETAVRTDYWSDDFVRELKAAYEAGDNNRVMEMIEPFIIRHTRRMLADPRMGCFFPSLADKEDALQEVRIHAMKNVAKFFRDPSNDPDSGAEQIRWTGERVNYWKQTIIWKLNDMRKKIGRQVRTYSYDAEVKNQDGDEYQKKEELSDGSLALDEQAVNKEKLQHTLERLYSLKNDPETLLAVGYMILNNVLGGGKLSYRDYSEVFCRASAKEILLDTHELLMRVRIDSKVLKPLYERLDFESDAWEKRGWEENMLANRKHMVLKRMKQFENDIDN